MAGVKEGEGDKLRLERQAGPYCKGPYQLRKKLGFSLSVVEIHPRALRR